MTELEVSDPPNTHVVMVGLSHQEAPVELRERLHGGPDYRELLGPLRRRAAEALRLLGADDPPRGPRRGG